MAQELSKPLRTSIYVINLERSIERRTMFEAHVAASQTSVAWVYHRAHTELSGDLDNESRYWACPEITTAWHEP